MRRILIADDDAHIRDVVSFALRRAGFATLDAADGRAALDAFRDESPDLVVLDVLMPEMDGVDVCRAIRRTSNVPILFLSSKDEEADRVAGLDAGGDDYVTKPFSPRELVARVHATFRGIDARAEEPVSEVVVGPLVVDAPGRRALLHGDALLLTGTEFGLLETFARNAGTVVDRATLMRGAYLTRRVVSERTIDSHVRRLREKLRQRGSDPIRTVHGVGYRLSFEEPSAPRMREPSAGERARPEVALEFPLRGNSSAGEGGGRAPREREPSAGEAGGLAPRMKEPSAGEREGLAPRMQEQREGLTPRMQEPSAGRTRE